MLAPAIARELRLRGHDVESVRGRSDWQALSDAEVVEVARRERRAIVINNLRDFRPLHHEAIVPGGPGHFGMVFVPGSYQRTKADIGRIATALERKLAEYPGEETSPEARQGYDESLPFPAVQAVDFGPKLSATGRHERSTASGRAHERALDEKVKQAAIAT